MDVNANNFQYAKDEQEYVDQQIGLHNLAEESHPALIQKISEILNSLNGFISKEAGKGLSENDYSDAEKEKVSNLINSLNELILTVQNLSKDVENKVSKEPGKILSEKSYTNQDAENLSTAYKTSGDNKAALAAHIADSLRHVTNEEKKTWNQSATKADEALLNVSNVMKDVGVMVHDITILQQQVAEYGQWHVSHFDRLDELEKDMGNIETALDSIIAMQNELVGGDAS